MAKNAASVSGPVSTWAVTPQSGEVRPSSGISTTGAVSARAGTPEGAAHGASSIVITSRGSRSGVAPVGAPGTVPDPWATPPCGSSDGRSMIRILEVAATPFRTCRRGRSVAVGWPFGGRDLGGPPRQGGPDQELSSAIVDPIATCLGQPGAAGTNGLASGSRNRSSARNGLVRITRFSPPFPTCSTHTGKRGTARTTSPHLSPGLTSACHSRPARRNRRSHSVGCRAVSDLSDTSTNKTLHGGCQGRGSDTGEPSSRTGSTHSTSPSPITVSSGSGSGATSRTRASAPGL